MADGGESSSRLGFGDELIMLVAKTPDAVLEISYTSAVECNNSVDTPHQHAAFYLSALAGIFPGLLPLAKEMFQGLGYAVREVTEDTVAEHLITLQPWINVCYAVTIFGQLALIIYKNIDERSYAGFMQRRTTALKAVAGVCSDLMPGKGDILLSVSTAKHIRNIVGGSNKIRAALLEFILANRVGGNCRLNSVCNYLAEIISWTEMGSLKFMFDTFCVTNSSVLKDGRVEREARNLREAYERVNEQEYPQYYRIMHPDEARTTIALYRFPTLAEVARRYRNEQHGTGSRFAASSNSQNNTLVNDLLSIHRKFMTQPQVLDDEMEERIRFLTTFDLYGLARRSMERGGD